MSRRFGTVDQMGEDVLRADVMGVDVLKLDVMALPRIFSILCRFLLQISDYHHLWYCFYANSHFMVVIYWISKMRKVWNKTIDCTASMFAVKAKIYGVLYNQARSIAFDETSSDWSALKSS